MTTSSYAKKDLSGRRYQNDIQKVNALLKASQDEGRAMNRKANSLTIQQTKHDPIITLKQIDKEKGTIHCLINKSQPGLLQP